MHGCGSYGLLVDEISSLTLFLNCKKTFLKYLSTVKPISNYSPRPVIYFLLLFILSNKHSKLKANGYARGADIIVVLLDR